MPVHLMKLCVGADSVDDLVDWHVRQAATLARAGRDPRPVCATRNTPKRREEALDGGSLYWVVKGVILVRQPIVDIVSVTGDGPPGCAIVLAAEYVRTAPQPRRAFQGWRYLEAKDAPPDLAAASGGEDLPDGLRRELIALGAW